MRLEPPLQMDRREAARLVFLVALPSLAIGLFWTSRGAWPVLPFTGIEVLVFAAVLFSIAARKPWQEISLKGAEVVVRDHRGGAWSFPRRWLWVRFQGGELWIGSQGRWVEIGPFLPLEERKRLAARLQQLTEMSLHPMWA